MTSPKAFSLPKDVIYHEPYGLTKLDTQRNFSGPWPITQDGIEPTYLDIGDINGALGLIFPMSDDANPFAQFNQPHAN